MHFSGARGTFPIEISIHSDRLSIQIYGQKTDIKVLNIFSIETYQIFPAMLFLIKLNWITYPWPRPVGLDRGFMLHFYTCSAPTARFGLLYRNILVHHELLELGQTIYLTLYCQRLVRLKQTIKKRPGLINSEGVVFHRDNARPHISLVTRQKLRKLSWEALMHPPKFPKLHA